MTHKLTLLICCVDPGGAWKSQYIIVSDPMTVVDQLRAQTDTVFCLLYGQWTKCTFYQKMTVGTLWYYTIYRNTSRSSKKEKQSTLIKMD